jgi:hypothetical protein
MFTKKPSREIELLDSAIDEIIREMDGVTTDTKDYSNMTDQLVKLMKLKKELTSSMKVSPDTLAIIAANLVGIVLIIGHERVNVIASKALSFVMKAK